MKQRRVYRPPGTPRWWHKLLIDIDCNPDQTAEDLSVATGYKPATAEAYLCSMIRAGIVACTPHTDEDGEREPSTYALTEAGDCHFDEIISADTALKRLA